MVSTIFLLSFAFVCSKAVAQFPGSGNSYMPPGDDDVRSPCPAINTLANHGFLSRDGKGISVENLMNELVEKFSFSEAVVMGPINAARSNNLTYMETTPSGEVEVIDIDSLHALQRQASFVRVDKIEGDPAFKEVSPALVTQFIEETAQDSPVLSREDFMKYQGRRAVNSLRVDEEFEFNDAQIGAMSTQAVFALSFGQRPGLDFAPKDFMTSFLEMEMFPTGFDPANYQIVYDFSDGSSSAIARTEFNDNIRETIEEYEDDTCQRCVGFFECFLCLLRQIFLLFSSKL